MGKSFNDDIFNNNFNIDSINGLNISKEAIEENKGTTKPKIDLGNINLDDIKEQIKEEKQKKPKNPQDEIDKLMQEQERLKETQQEQSQEDTTTYVKKTMIFNQDYLYIIDGLSEINDIDKKDVLNQLLGRAISELDIKIQEKALKTGKKIKPKKESKSIY